MCKFILINKIVTINPPFIGSCIIIFYLFAIPSYWNPVVYLIIRKNASTNWRINFKVIVCVRIFHFTNSDIYCQF